MNPSESSTSYLAEYPLIEWLRRHEGQQAPNDPKGLLTHPAVGSLSLRHITSSSPETVGGGGSKSGLSSRMSIFSIEQEVLLLRVSGTLREPDAQGLLQLFQTSTSFTNQQRPSVILDLTEVTSVAYQARKRLILALHVLRNRSRKVYMIGSPTVQALMEMQDKMYPLSTSMVHRAASLLHAMELALRPDPDLPSPFKSSAENPSEMNVTPQDSQSATNIPPRQPTGQNTQLEQLEQLRSVLNSAPDPIYSLDLEGHFIDTNHAGKAFFRDYLQKPFWIGQELLSAWPLFTQQEWSEVLAGLGRGEAWQGRVSIPYQEEEQCFWLSFSAVTRGQGGKVTGISLFLRDITEESKAQEEAKYQRELLDSISYSIQEGLFRSSPQRGIMFVNQAFVEMFGYDDIEEVIRLDPYELYVNVSRRDDFVRIVQQANSFFNEEVQFKRKDGSTFWGLISSVRKVDKNGMVYHDGAIRNVTQIREAQQRIKEKHDELMKVNRELDSFVYSVSHDLRAPLVSLLGLINITKMEASDDNKMRYLGLMEKSIARLDHFIQDIITYSRNSRMELQSVPVNLKALVNEAVESLRFAQDGHLEIRNLVPASLILRSDLQRLKPIINNLLSNAIRYRDMNKAVQWVDISAAATDEGVELSFRDNGIGIALEHQEKVFEMFYRATTKSQGSGIGLYIVRETVLKLQGKIHLETTEGLGSSFILTLPHDPEKLEKK